MDATQAKTRTEKKQFVQAELMHGLANTLGYWTEKLSDGDREALGADGLASIKFSVRSQYFSGGSAIDIRLTGVPQSWGWEQRRDEWGRMRWMYSPAMKALMDELKHVMDAYNHDGSDIMTDYFDVRFYGSVETDWNEDPSNSRAA